MTGDPELVSVAALGAAWSVFGAVVLTVRRARPSAVVMVLTGAAVASGALLTAPAISVRPGSAS